MRIWNSINPRTDELISIDMILMDAEGEVIHAIIWKNLADTFIPKIKESCIYVFNNFKVDESTIYRPVNNDLKIIMLSDTKVKEVKGLSDRFQEYYFEFASKETLLERQEKDEYCSDVIGLLTQIKPIESRITRAQTDNPRTADMREIEILIPEGDKVRVTLWENLAHSLSDDVVGKQTVLIITSTMVQKFNGLSLKSTSATRLYENLDIPESLELQDSYSTEDILSKMMEIDKSTQGTLEQQMFYNRKTLREITEIRHEDPKNQDLVYTALATIDRLQENIQWWYMACGKCNKLATKENGKYYCKNCNKYPENVTPRYRIRLQISDPTATTSCTLFDEEANRILNKSVTDLLDSLIGKSEEIPKIIQELCGKRLIFRFKLNKQNLTLGTPNYAVKRTFVPDENLERQHFNDEVEEELMDDGVDMILTTQKKSTDRPVIKRQSSICSPMKSIVELKAIKKELEDLVKEIEDEQKMPSSGGLRKAKASMTHTNEKKGHKNTRTVGRKCITRKSNKRRKSPIVLSDDSEVDDTENTEVQDEDSDVEFARKKVNFQAAVKTCKKKSKEDGVEHRKEKPNDQLEDQVSQKRPKRIRQPSKKYQD